MQKKREYIYLVDIKKLHTDFNLNIYIYKLREQRSFSGLSNIKYSEDHPLINMGTVLNKVTFCTSLKLSYILKNSCYQFCKCVCTYIIMFLWTGSYYFGINYITHI